MKVDFHTKEFNKSKYEVLSKDDYIYLRDNYNRFTELIKKKHKEELKNLLKANYNYKILGKVFLFFCIYIVCIEIIKRYIDIYDFFEWIIIIWVGVIVFTFQRIYTGRSFTKDSYKTYLNNVTDYYYYHRLTIENTNSYEDYKLKVDTDSKKIYNVISQKIKKVTGY